VLKAQVTLGRNDFVTMPAYRSTACNAGGTICANRDSGGSAISVVERSTGRLLRSISSESIPGNPTPIALATDGTLLASTDNFNFAGFAVWDTLTGRRVFRRGQMPAGTVFALAFSPDDRQLALVTTTGGAELWDVTNWRLLDSTTGFQGPVSQLTVRDGVVTGWVPGGRLQRWTLGNDAVVLAASAPPAAPAGKAPIAIFDSEHADPYAAEFEMLPGDRILLPGQTGRIFDLRNGTFEAFGSDPDGIAELEVAGSTLVAVGGRSKASILNASTLQPIETPLWPANLMAVSQDGALAAFGSGEVLTVRSRVGGAERERKLEARFDSAFFSLDGKVLVVREDDRVLNAFASDTLEPLPFPQIRTLDGSVSEDLRYAANVLSGDGVRVFAPLANRGLFMIPGDAHTTQFSADGRLLAIERPSGVIEIFDMETRSRVSALAGFPGSYVSRLRFTPDGKRFVASNGNLIRAWDIATQQQLLTLSIVNMNWAVITPGGYYDGTAAELKEYYWVKDLHSQVLDSLLPEHRVPGLLALAWNGGAPAAVGNVGTVLSAPDIATIASASETSAVSPADTSTAEFTVRIAPPAAGKDFSEPLTVVGNRNGVPFEVGLSGSDQAVFQATVPLVEGANRISLAVQDGLGRLSGERVIERPFRAEGRRPPEIVPAVAAPKIVGAAFSPTASYLATSTGHSVMLWDMHSKRQVRSMLDHKDYVTQVAFAGSDATLLSLATDSTLRVWETSTGREHCRIGLLNRFDHLPSFAVSPDGSQVALNDSRVNLIRVFAVSDCREQMSFSADGIVSPVWLNQRKIIAAGERDDRDKLVIFDAITGATSMTGAGGEIQTIAGLPGGHTLVLLKDGRVRTEAAAGGFEDLDHPMLPGKIDRILTFTSGKLLLDGGNNGKVLLAADRKTELRRWKLGYLATACVSADESSLAFVTTLSELSVYRLASNVPERIALEPGLGAVTQIRFSKAGDVMTTARANGPVLFWDIASSNVFDQLGKNDRFQQGPKLLVARNLGQVAIVQPGLSNGKLTLGLQTLPMTLEVARNQSGELEVSKLDLDNNHVFSFPIPLPRDGASPNYGLSDSLDVVWTEGQKPGEIVLTDLKTSHVLTHFRAHPGFLNQAAVSADGKRILTVGDGNDGVTVRLWNSQGQPLWRREGFAAAPSSLAFNGDRTEIALATPGTILLVAGDTGATRRVLRLEPSVVTALAFTPDNSRLAAGTDDGLIHLFDVQTGALLVTWAADEKGSMTYLPTGFYSGSLSRSNSLSFRVGGRVYPLRQFDLRYNRPDRVMQVLAPELAPVISAYRSAYGKRLLQAHLTEADLSGDAVLPEVFIEAPTQVPGDSEISLALQAKAGAGSTLDHIELRVNGVREPDLPTAGKAEWQGAAVVVLSTGSNAIEATAVDRHGARSLAEQVSLDRDDKVARHKLFVATIGISTYKNSSMNLHFAAKDALDLADYFKTRSRSFALGQSPFDELVLLPALTNIQASQSSILGLREQLAAAGPDDTVVIFFAGHGILDTKLDFFLAPYEMNFAEPAESGLSIAQLEDLFTKSRSRRRLLLVDACHSGELDASEVASDRPPGSAVPVATVAATSARGTKVNKDQGTANAFELLRSLFADLRDNTGTEILSASGGTESAYESDTVANGFFTRAVLEGLKDTAADSDGDGHVSIEELIDFVSTRVSELSGGKQTPTRRQHNLDQSFVIE
jgi:WD40 repeat protein